MNLKKSLKRVKMFGIIGLLALTCASCSSSWNLTSSEIDNQGWKVVKVDKAENPAWIISTRNEVGTNFLEYKIEGDIDATTEACIAAFKKDILNQAAHLKNKKYPTYEIVSESSDSLLTYVIHHEPFPLKDTEMSIMYFFSNDEDGTTGVTWHEAWDVNPVPPSKKLSRVKTFRGSWSFAPTSSHANLAVNSVQFDPKGMPLWLVKPMVMKFLKNGLEDIRGATSK